MRATMLVVALVVSLLTGCSLVHHEPKVGVRAGGPVATPVGHAEEADCPAPSLPADDPMGIYCEDGVTLSRVVGRELAMQYPHVMTLLAEATWPATREALCTDAHPDEGQAGLMKAYTYVWDLNGWYERQHPEELIPQVWSDDELCPHNTLPLAPTSCPAAKTTEQTPFADVLCDDLSPRAQAEAELKAAAPQTMALGEGAWQDAIDVAVCQDLAKGAKARDVARAYAWVHARHGWYWRVTADGLSANLGEPTYCPDLPKPRHLTRDLFEPVSLGRITIDTSDEFLMDGGRKPQTITAALLVSICTDARHQIRWDQWTMTDTAGGVHRPSEPFALPEDNAVLHPFAETIDDSACFKGWLTFEMPDTEDAVSYHFANGYGEQITWLVN